MSDERVLYYRGKRVEDCDRDELLACAHWLARTLENERKWHHDCLEVNDLLWDTKEKLRRRA